jgi:hypothetical protein
MKTARGSEVCGVEVVRLGDALRQTDPTAVTPGRLADRLAIPDSESSGLCAALARAGYPELTHPDPEHPQ